MALFSRLLNLNTGSIPLEDFFTELIAYLFSKNKEVLCAWLEELNLLDTNSALDTHVSTQREFEPLDGHLSGSRPDLLIELIDDSRRSIIFIESKVASQEGYEQLSRYAEILHSLPGFHERYLLYITCDFEPKNAAVIFKKIPESNVQFKQLRWHQFYRFLQSHASTMLVQEIIEFMSEHQMAHNNQFSSIDVIALANFTKSLKMMEETMWGEVSQRFEKALGGIRRQNAALTQVQLHGRYLMVADMRSGGWWCGLGFMLKTSSMTDYPTVRLMLEVSPNSSHRVEIIEAMKAICKQYDWQGDRLNEAKAWSSIFQEKSLQFFLSEEDHVAAIQKFFRETLDELEKIKEQYPNLPWTATPDSGEGSADS